MAKALTWTLSITRKRTDWPTDGARAGFGIAAASPGLGAAGTEDAGGGVEDKKLKL